MSRRSVHKTPNYRKHKAAGQAVVTIEGRDHYLGLYGSEASRAEYDRLIAEWLRGGRGVTKAMAFTVSEVILAYWHFAETYYIKDGKVTSELSCLKVALKPLRKLYGQTLADEFGPIALKTIREQFVKAGLTRGGVNISVGRMSCHAFLWKSPRAFLLESIGRWKWS